LHRANQISSTWAIFQHANDEFAGFVVSLSGVFADCKPVRLASSKSVKNQLIFDYAYYTLP